MNKKWIVEVESHEIYKKDIDKWHKLYRGEEYFYNAMGFTGAGDNYKFDTYEEALDFFNEFEIGLKEYNSCLGVYVHFYVIGLYTVYLDEEGDTEYTECEDEKHPTLEEVYTLLNGEYDED